VYQGGVARIEVRRSGDRFVTDVEGRTTRHSFSFDRHYDPDNIAMGFLVCNNDDLVLPGHGYPDHPHRELEIVTWVLDGSLRHADWLGRATTVTPGVAQRLCAGSGVVHAELNDGPGPVRFVQMWVRPGESGLPPAYHLQEAQPGAGWLTLASGLPAHREATALPLSNPGAGLHVARLGPGDAARLPEAALLHLFVAEGAVTLERQGVLAAGDAARLFDSGGQQVTAVDASELLLWEMHLRPATRDG
jgi:redox-sensitive bicupin YhaK (pirin superfamily)